jgi:nucleoside-diphosphate-sugar epimerase
MYPSDMAFWLLNILVQGTVGASYNVGSHYAVTLRQLAEKIADHFPLRPKIISRVAEEGNSNHSKFVPDISLAQKTLGLSLRVDIETAIKRTIAWNRYLLE